MTDKVDIITLKKQLPRGYGQRIARVLNITPQAVSIAMQGKNPMHPAIIEAVRIRDEHREQLQQLTDSISN